MQGLFQPHLSDRSLLYQQRVVDPFDNHPQPRPCSLQDSLFAEQRNLVRTLSAENHELRIPADGLLSQCGV